MRHFTSRRAFRQAAAFIMATAILSAPALAQQDVLGAAGPLTFEGTQFALAWTGDNDVEAVQEYLPAGQSLESYDEMFIIRAATPGNTPLATAQSMAASLEARRATDPVLNYDLIQNEAKGEVILDFLLSDSSSGTMVVEWNAYRYLPLEGGVVSYAISRRGYGDDAAAFLGKLKDWRQDSITALATMVVPDVGVAD